MLRSWRKLAWWTAAMVVAGSVASCGSGPDAGTRRAAEVNPAWALADRPPADFTLSVTVYAPTRPELASRTGAGQELRQPPADQDPNEPQPRYLRPMRALVQPDLSLRATSGDVSPKTYPSLTRRLSAEEHRRLWWDLRESGLLREHHPEEVSSELAATPTSETMPRRGLYIISYVAAGHRRTLAVDPVLSDDAPGARRLVDRLAALAWIE